MPLVIFAVDGSHDMTQTKKVMRALDDLRAIWGRAARFGVGKWTDPDGGRVHIEPCFGVDLNTYETSIAGRWTRKQKCVLVVDDDGRAYTADPATLARLPGGDLGMMQRVEDMPAGDWTKWFDGTGFWTAGGKPTTRVEPVSGSLTAAGVSG